LVHAATFFKISSILTEIHSFYVFTKSKIAFKTAIIFCAFKSVTLVKGIIFYHSVPKILTLLSWYKRRREGSGSNAVRREG